MFIFSFMSIGPRVFLARKGWITVTWVILSPVQWFRWWGLNYSIKVENMSFSDTNEEENDIPQIQGCLEFSDSQTTPSGWWNLKMLFPQGVAGGADYRPEKMNLIGWAKSVMQVLRSVKKCILAQGCNAIPIQIPEWMIQPPTSFSPVAKHWKFCNSEHVLLHLSAPPLHHHHYLHIVPQHLARDLQWRKKYHPIQSCIFMVFKI